MKKIALLSVFLLSGCAASRGFLVGAFGGIPTVDEAIHKEYDPDSLHTNLKVFGHQGMIISTSYVLWPLAAAYGGVSGIYGAYQFWKWRHHQAWAYIIRSEDYPATIKLK